MICLSCSWLKCFVLHVVPVIQVEKAPLESYADVGGLEQQVQEIKEAVELPLTNPELYEDIGIKPPKVHMGWMAAALQNAICGVKIFRLPCISN